MIFSVTTIGIMLCLDIYIYDFLQDKTGDHFSPLNIAIVIIGRLLQYHLVNLFIYFFLYWPYRRTFEAKENNYDLQCVSELEVNDLSIIRSKETITE